MMTRTKLMMGILWRKMIDAGWNSKIAICSVMSVGIISRPGGKQLSAFVYTSAKSRVRLRMVFDLAQLGGSGSASSLGSYGK